MKVASGIIAVLFVFAASGCTEDAPSSSPEPSPTQSEQTETSPKPEKPRKSKTPQAKGPLMFKIIGNCTSESGTLTSVSSGFTPGGPYSTEAWYPSGKPYTQISNPGYASGSGSTPGWNWPCAEGETAGKGDPPGEYRAVITDLTTGKSIETSFVVGKP